jgi:glycerol uptake facilitator-like aquaporin
MNTQVDLARRIAAEALGSCMLLIAVVGSGIMAERLAGGNAAIALLANAVATGAALVVLVAILGPLSGAHFNPCVSLYFALRGEISFPLALAYSIVQIVSAVVGVWFAHAMFAMPVLEFSAHVRGGLPQMLAEFIATFGLLATIAGGVRYSPSSLPILIGLYITGAYWFTASTSFANPAVTMARALTDSFSGIAPASVPGFIAAQFLAVLAGWVLFRWLFPDAAV